MIEYRIINNNEYLELAKLRWIFQSEEDISLDLLQKDKFINDCLQVLLSS